MSINIIGYSTETIDAYAEFNAIRKALVKSNKPKKRKEDFKRCCYCECRLHDHNKSRDHLIPKHAGGNITRDCCIPCNQEKGGMFLEDYVLFLQTNFSDMSKTTLEIKKLTKKIKNAKLLIKGLYYDGKIKTRPRAIGD